MEAQHGPTKASAPLGGGGGYVGVHVCLWKGNQMSPSLGRGRIVGACAALDDPTRSQQKDCKGSRGLAIRRFRVRVQIRV